MTAVIFAEKGDQIVVKFPYDPDAVARLKDTVPGHERSWDNASKQWVIGSRWGNELTEVLIAGGHTVRGEGEKPPPVTALDPEHGPGSMWTPAEDRAWAKAHAAEVIESIPENLRHRFLREYAKLLYPEMYERGRAG